MTLGHPQNKVRWHYILATAYFAFATVCWLGALYWGFSVMNNGGSLREWTGNVLPVIFVLVVPAMFLGFSAFAFPIGYSVFVSHNRTPFPDEVPIRDEKYTWGRLGFFYGSIPLYRWIVFPTGLGVSVFGIGRAFVHVGQIVRLQPHASGWYELHHSSPELRNPIILPSKGLFESVQAVVKEAGRNIAPD